MQSAVMSSAEFVSRLKEEIKNHPKQRVNHPFVRAVCAGKASIEQIREWALQDYQFRSAVPRIASCATWRAATPSFSRDFSRSSRRRRGG